MIKVCNRTFSGAEDEDVLPCVDLELCDSVMRLVELYASDSLPPSMTKASVIRHVRPLKCDDKMTPDGERKIKVRCRGYTPVETATDDDSGSTRDFLQVAAAPPIGLRQDATGAVMEG